eukprot:jgi/Orpsp1_1/1174525/evm.model.c7180000050458.1
MVSLLMTYANEHEIVLELNEKNIIGWNPLLRATFKNNTEMIKLLLDYANEHSITLNLNEKIFIYEWQLVYLPILKNNIEIIELFGNYASEHGTTLEINEKDVALSKISQDIIELIYSYKEQNIVNIEFQGEESELLKKFKEIESKTLNKMK